MTVKIGIPRGLWFYDYYPLWKTFYESLGAEVIVSDITNKVILDQGVRNTVDEACLPVKIFHGHVLNLKDRVDYIFVPKMMSVYKNEYICPKFCGLPEMVQHSIPNLPPLIDTEINFNKSRKSLMKTVFSFGSYVTKNPIKIRNAYLKALEEYYQYKEHMKNGYIPINGIYEEKEQIPHINYRRRIAVIGHTYHIYDSYGSMNLIKKLKQQAIDVVIPEMIDMKTINDLANSLEKKMFWSYGRKILGAALHYTENKEIDGIIYISSFGCGIDSVIEDIFERWSRRSGMPFLLLTIDEHTGEAGVNTRLEAFIDMIDWRSSNEGNLSTHG
ncbi:acyl-CoA dehydratase activase-related protein [Alkaliphilus peptidifermentans]|uniref:Predicted nucleotide-binding protein, sugar kinase/HSP70/actin superfamily n=1 Tax=Alkaliphilus peptidifermentans DSM 18978 TaxID=1120976 RepID=A0A1G5HV07_9FIRM|nr:acyl-CoA dehydratase activase-related protein [Alkaliphilus peptidifermentans]SCY67554.1 Predicted nucleotide-binding protein, sugar kinase/HSP70/actin superfamily [Alkaliphilus peptidifermentans DSM 18978]